MVTGATPRRGFTPQQRRFVYERDEGRCKLCGQPVALEECAIDHIIPISKGGPHQLDNWQLSHPACNSSKHDKLPAMVPSSYIEKRERHYARLEKRLEELEGVEQRYLQMSQERERLARQLLDWKQGWETERAGLLRALRHERTMKGHYTGVADNERRHARFLWDGYVPNYEAGVRLPRVEAALSQARADLAVIRAQRDDYDRWAGRFALVALALLVAWGVFGLWLIFIH